MSSSSAVIVAGADVMDEDQNQLFLPEHTGASQLTSAIARDSIMLECRTSTLMTVSQHSNLTLNCRHVQYAIH